MLVNSKVIKIIDPRKLFNEYYASVVENIDEIL